jgi:iron-sulfur cluster assembly accessory protein
MITLSPTAIAEINRLNARHPDQAASFRLGIRPQGCAGLSYQLDFGPAGQADRQFNYPGLTVGLAIAPEDLAHLTGLAIDYSEDLMGGGFQFQNPNASKSCGCGISFEPSAGN